MNIKKVILSLLLIFTFGINVKSQTNFDKTKLDSYFDTLELHNKFMGSVAVSKNGEIIYTKSIGYSDIEKNDISTVNSKYRIGSISKTFTTVLILKAVEENKIDLNQTIENFFPSIKNSKKITIKLLLSHRSGIHNFTSDKDYLTWNNQSKTEKQMIEIITKGGNDFKPDSKAEYSNSNFVLLSFILEKTFLKSYSEILQEYIVKPLELKNTYVFGKINTEQNECKSYYFYSGNWMLAPETDSSIPIGAGAIISTPSDLVKFANALFHEKLLKRESLEIMKTLKDNYGIGLFQIPFYNKIGFGHNGGIDGFSSNFCYFNDGDISYALTSNGTNYDNNKISISVLSAVFEKQFEIPIFSNFTITSDQLDQYLGEYSSKKIKLKITISKDGNILQAKGSGQPMFPLEVSDINKFCSEEVKAYFEFNPSEKSFILKQGGEQYTFIKIKE